MTFTGSDSLVCCWTDGTLDKAYCRPMINTTKTALNSVLLLKKKGEGEGITNYGGGKQRKGNGQTDNGLV